MSSATSFVLLIFAIFCLAFVPHHAAESPAELYWKAKMGNIPMPKVLKDSLQLGLKDGISTTLMTQNYGHKSMDHDFGTLAPLYKRSYSGAQLPQDGRTMYFTDEMLYKKGGAKTMKLDFMKTDNKGKFLPLQMTKSMAISPSKILNLLSVNDPKSIAAQDIEKTIKECADNGVKGEVRFCATSLEDMVDYANYRLSNSGESDLKTLSMDHDIESLKEYKVQKAHKIGIDAADSHNLVCHKMSNPYAVFLCHNVKNTMMHDVSLLGANGDQLKAVAVCHMDTSSWNPKHLAFQLLKIKPGSKPVCHFLSGNDIVWLPTN